MSDEASNPLSGSEELLNSSQMSGKAVLVINDQGKVLVATPECETAFNITEGQFILFDLDTQGIRTKLVTEDDDTPSPLIPYLEIHEIQHQGEHCFGLLLDTSSPVPVPSPVVAEHPMNLEYQDLPGAVYHALDDENLTIAEVTSGSISLLGIAPEDIINNTKLDFASLVHPEDLPLVRESRQKAVSENSLYEIIYRIRHSDGEYRVIGDQGRAIHSDTGQFLYFEGWLLSKHEEKTVEEEKTENEARYRYLVEVSPDAVVYTDASGTIRMANKQFAQMLEIDEGMGLVGTNVLQFLDQKNNTELEKDMVQQLKKGEAHKGKYLAQTTKGRTVPVEVNIRSINPQDNVPSGYIAIIRDMSDWEHTIQSLKTREAQYRAIVEDNPELIVRFTQDGTVTFCNQSYASYYGVKVRDLIGRKLLDALPNQAKPTIQMILNYVSPNMEPTVKDVTSEGPNHETRWYRWKTRGILDENGKLIEYQSIGEDITDEKNARQAHQLSEQMIRSLFESINLLAIMMDPTGKVTFVNSHYLEVTGWDKQQVLGENWTEKFVPPEVGFQLKKILFDGMIIGRIAQRNDNMILTRTGEQRLISWHNTLLFNDRHIPQGIASIGEDITEQFYAEKTQEVVYKIAQSTISASNLTELYTSIHKALLMLMPVDNFSIALYDRQTELLSYPYFVDQYDPCPEPEHLGRGLTEYVFRTGRTLLANPEVFNLLVEEDAVESVGTPCVDWLGVPLIIDNEVIGVMSSQSYTEGIRFKKRDEQMLNFVSTQVAMAIERKRSEQALQNSQRRNELLVEATTDGIVLETLDGRIIDCNEIAEKMYGYTREELLTKRVVDLVSPDFLVDKPDYIDWEIKHSAMVSDIPNRRKDGSIFPVEVSTRLATIENQTVAVAYIRDITERKKTEQAIVESEEKFRTLAQTAAAGIFIHKGGPYLYVNPKWIEITGYSEEELLQKEFLSIFATGSHTVVEKHFQDRLQNDRSVKRYEAEIFTKTGQTKWVDITTSGIIYQGMEAIIGTAVDITDRKQKENELEMVAKISEALRVALSREEIRPTVLREIMNFLDVDGALISTIENSDAPEILDRALGCFEPADMTRLKVSEGLTGHIIATGKTYTNHDAPNDPYFSFPKMLQSLTSLAGVPLITKGETIGALLIGAAHILTENEIRLLKTIGDMTASAIHRSDLYEQTSAQARELKQAYDATLEGWAHALELRDKETQGHSLRIANLTLKLAGRMGYKETSLENVRRGALLHDIGKMGVPDTILLKPGSLNEDEWALMRKHPEYAREMLIALPYFSDAIDIPYCHHEWWDGSGYPRGLKGNEIPLAARIFAIVDAWDALISDRPYRKAWSKRDALSHIIDQSGNHFDPEVVNSFVQMLKDENI